MAGVYSDADIEKAMNRGLDDWGNWNCLRLEVERLRAALGVQK